MNQAQTASVPALLDALRRRLPQLRLMRWRLQLRLLLHLALRRLEPELCKDVGGAAAGLAAAAADQDGDVAQHAQREGQLHRSDACGVLNCLQVGNICRQQRRGVV